MGTPLLEDRRSFEVSSDDMQARVAAAITKAFGSKTEQPEPAVWQVVTTERGIEHHVVVRLEERGGHCDVAVAVEARRRPRAKAALAATTLLTVLAWMAAAALTFTDFRGPQAGRFVPWIVSLAMSFGLTALLLGLLKHWRVNAMSSIDAIDKLWRELAAREDAPRIGRGYRIAPELATPDAAEVEALAAEEEGVENAAHAERNRR